MTQQVVETRILHIVNTDTQPIAVFGALTGCQAATHPRFAQVFDQGDILDLVALEGGFGKITGDAEMVGPIN